MSTINKDEINKFSKIANEWWDINGKFKPLHIFNPIRIEYILDIVLSHFKIKKDKKLPLKNLKILDIGCGGGLISEPMSRLGANVTGIDASNRNIQVAKLHAKKNNLKINYLNTVPENLEQQNKFDIILNLEVVEHVENLDLYLSSCFKLLKKDGIMFTATITRTLTSYIKAIVGAE
jgi:2-polyprenyl-6-hydroxyphenyl methylase/3-demethylubiquinone-9 3-methyltransferase